MPDKKSNESVVIEETEAEPVHDAAAEITLAEITRRLAELAEQAKSLVDQPPEEMP
ncbi:hypothetical protein [Rhizobium sp. LCM 4573]|uniref:hypothetical protein n=1 Tax=Rhizobium sp. LCM 4573 TaxID=1848291 RepID=UPI0012FF77FE|nr:hypothetical protein [Rhizobium sp. LCM 4573]